MKLNFIFPVLFVCIGIISACHPPEPASSGKIDGRLMQLMEQNADVQLDFSGQCSGSIEEALKSRMESTGVIIQTVAGDIFTAKGNREQIQKLSQMQEVIRLQAPKKSYLLDHK